MKQSWDRLKPAGFGALTREYFRAFFNVNCMLLSVQQCIMGVTLRFLCSSRRMRTLAAALSPAFLRFGGTRQDFMVFEPHRRQQWEEPQDAAGKHDHLVTSLTSHWSGTCWFLCFIYRKWFFNVSCDSFVFSLSSGWRLFLLIQFLSVETFK